MSTAMHVSARLGQKRRTTTTITILLCGQKVAELEVMLYEAGEEEAAVQVSCHQTVRLHGCHELLVL